MMIRAIVDIKSYSTFLATSHGDVTVDYIDWRQEKTLHSITKVARCCFTFANSSIKYNRIEECQKGAFEATKPQISQMITSYMRGLTLAKHDNTFAWDSCNVPLDQWLEKKRKENENI